MLPLILRGAALPSAAVSALYWRIGMRESLEVCAHQANQIFRQLNRRYGVLCVARDVQTDMVFEYLGHQAVDPSANVGQQHQDVRTIVAGGEGAFDGVDLPANPLYARH